MITPEVAPPGRAPTERLPYFPLARINEVLNCRNHVTTYYRWTSRGCRGVKLRYTQVGSTRCTTVNWLEDFFDALTRAGAAPESPGSAHALPPPPTPRRRQQAAERAGRELSRSGF